MKDNIGLWFVFNDFVKQEEQLKNIKVPEKELVYEVIRIIKGVPLFFEDHFTRLKETFNLLGFELMISEEGLKKQIHKLVRACNQKDCNVKVIVYTEHKEQNCLIYLSKYYYPSKEEIEEGVSVGLFQWERQNPNAKVINQQYKENVSKKITEEKVFEVLLVNNQNEITEGSRSNVFFIKENKVFTAPGECILKGITRQYVFEACKKAAVEVVERLVSMDELKAMEGVFISGTSIKVLPVSNIDDFVYQSASHPTIVGIRDQFDLLINNYVNKKS